MILPTPLFTIPSITRMYAGGTFLTSSDFVISGWGTGATITAIDGSDMAHNFTITAGANPSSSPALQLTFRDGAWAFPPVMNAQITGGTGQVSDLVISQSTTAYTLTYDGTPIATQTYTIRVICIGVLN